MRIVEIRADFGRTPSRVRIKVSRRAQEGKRALNCLQGRSASFRQRIVKKRRAAFRPPLSGGSFQNEANFSRLDAGVSGAIFRGVSGGFRGFPGVSGLISKIRVYRKIQFPDYGAGFPPQLLSNLKLKKGNGAGDTVF